MKKAVIALAFIVPLLFASIGFRPAFAHNETVVGDVKIVAGWGVEPPLVGQLNTIELAVTSVSDEKPITNAFASVDITIRKGGVSKPLEFRPGEQAGTYVTDIIPTQLGQYAITFSGTIAGQRINSQVEIEDAEDASRLNFPEGSGNPNQGVPEDFIEQTRTMITDLTTQVEEAKSAAQDAADSAQSATATRDAADRAYLIGIVGVGAGVAGIAIAAVALSRRT
jgi:hypothetical protein